LSTTNYQTVGVTDVSDPDRMSAKPVRDDARGIVRANSIVPAGYPAGVKPHRFADIARLEGAR